MIIYNVTIKVDHSIHDEWLQWMQAKHIPDVINTGCFTNNKIYKLLHQDETDGITYAIQYSCTDIAVLDKYQKEYAPALQKEHTEKYKEKFVAFRTILEEL